LRLIWASSIQARSRGRDDAAGVLLAVVGLGALGDHSLMGGAADLEGLAVEVFVAEGQHVPSLMPVSVKVRAGAS
jgi:hypothetical protein